MPTLYFVIPCYNEEKVINITFNLFYDKLMSLIGQNLVSKESMFKTTFMGTNTAFRELSEKYSDIINDFWNKNNFFFEDHNLYIQSMEKTLWN